MNKEFCINCGHKNLFEVSKPKFCAGCGNPFNTSNASAKMKAKEEIEDEDDYEGAACYDLEKLKASIVSESFSNKITLDQLWSDPAPRDPNSSRPASSDPSGTEILKQTMKECSKVKSAKDIDG